MRTLQINCAVFSDTPNASFDPHTGSGTISVPYVVGFRDTSGSTPDLTLHPTATIIGTASVTLSPTDTAPGRLQTLLQTILQQEGLSSKDGDVVLDQGGNRLA